VSLTLLGPQHLRAGELVFGPPSELRDWAKPVAAAALVRSRR
jgi:hypothetical protein